MILPWQRSWIRHTLGE